MNVRGPPAGAGAPRPGLLNARRLSGQSRKAGAVAAKMTVGNTPRKIGVRKVNKTDVFRTSRDGRPCRVE
jgi:hypothetical protein